MTKAVVRAMDTITGELISKYKIKNLLKNYFEYFLYIYI